MELILFQECSRRLDAMTIHGVRSIFTEPTVIRPVNALMSNYEQDKQAAVAEGNLFAASANLIRNLHRIMLAWKRKLAETQRLAAATPATLPSLGSGSNGITPATSSNEVATTSTETDYYISQDIFANWDNWPQAEDLDFSALLNGSAA